MQSISRWLPLLAAVSLSVASSPAFAQGSARSMDFDVSIRSTGMAGASNAVLWDGGLDHWANPALLGSERGIRYEFGDTQLIPEFAKDVTFKSNVLKLAAGGAGFVVSGKPFGGVRLDYGKSVATDEQGNLTGTFDSYEQVDSWGFGVNLFQTLETLTQLSGNSAAPFSRYLDFGYGMNFKDVTVALAPGYPGGGPTSTSARDWGAVARMTPLDVRYDDGTRVRLDAAFGWSVLSANDDAQLMFFFEQPSPVSRHRRTGGALHFVVDHPVGPSGRGEPGAWVREGLSPVVALTLAADRDHITAGASEDGYRTESQGAELTLANIISLRTGHYLDRLGNIDGEAWGVGIQLPIGKVAGIRYDGAQFPRSHDSGLKDLRRHAVSIWIDPLEWARAANPRTHSI